MPISLNNSITDVPGIRVGHAHDAEALTGCTVVMCEAGAVGGVDQRGGAPGTRETDLLRPMHNVQKVHAVLLAGGSAFGLDAAGGVMRYLEERGIGYDTGVARVPIVPAAILFDLAIGRSDVRPGPEMGYQACLNASFQPPEEGNAGAGMGATAGKLYGMALAMKSGIGSASIDVGGGAIVGALVAANPLGDIFDPETGTILAGVRSSEGGFGDSLAVLRSLAAMQATDRKQTASSRASGNTVIGVVATNAALTKEEANKVAQMAHDGLARVVRPAHTLYDGDTLFALSTGDLHVDVSVIGAFAAEAVAQAILRAARSARPAGGLPAHSSIQV